jgi:hydroxymethylpyrimidine pyrophosphatase-like HAD family hydrolase
VDHERWLLYELAHIWARQRRHPEEEAELCRSRSRAIQRYFAEVYLSDLPARPSGPLCALDVDGVLETEHLGFPAITPAAASALRALMLHGYRPLLVTGRSLEEVVDRCRSYGLVGGVAEYGAASYVTETGHVRRLLPHGAAPALGRLRWALREVEGVHVAGNYRFAVRAYTVDRHGTRRGLDSDTIVACITRAAVQRIIPIRGEGQTDFVFDGVDKATGLRALAADLGIADECERPFVLVVGDTVSDVPCATVSERACAPSHAQTALCEAGFERMTMPYQAGLAQAIATLIGHEPGGCRVCRPPPLPRERRELLAMLAAQERGRRSMVAQAAKLALGCR